MNKDLRLSINTFLSLVDVFKANGWEIPSADAGDESRFNRFCERLSILEISEQQLVIELTKKFTIIEASDYSGHIVKLLSHLHAQEIPIFRTTEKFLIMPLLAPKDFNKTKSSSYVWYYFRSEAIKFNPIFLGKKLVHCDISKATWAKNLKENEAVILVDDYIGSGQTAVDAVKWFESTIGVDSKKIVVLAVAAQEQGLQWIAEHTNASVYAHLHFTKGISDAYSGKQRESYLQTMTAIETKLNVEDEFRLGYSGSEALISLIRTPNNTFPVFWKPNGNNRLVPFSRD